MTWPKPKLLELKFRQHESWIFQALEEQAFRTGKTPREVLLRYISEGLLRDKGFLKKDAATVPPPTPKAKSTGDP